VEQAVRLLPAGYEEAAVALGALQRRREIRSPQDLLRLVMTYAMGGRSLRMTAALAELHGYASMSDVAVLGRLQSAGPWLGWMVLHSLMEGEVLPGSAAPMVRIIDASVVSEPGSVGTDWRVHLGLDLVRETIRSVEITNSKGGETLARHTIVPGEILVVDRGYAQRRGVAHALDHQGHVVVRLNWQNFPLIDAEGRPIVLPDALDTLQVGETGDRDAWFEHGGQRYKVRLVAHRKTMEPTEHDRKEIEHRARRQKRCVDPRTLLASCFVILVTDLPREILPADDVLALYRLRWRVEIAFKRLKSILRLKDLRAHDPRLVTTYLHAKLLAAILLDRLAGAEQAPASPPCGVDTHQPPTSEPLANAATAGGRSEAVHHGPATAQRRRGSATADPAATGRGTTSPTASTPPCLPPLCATTPLT